MILKLEQPGGKPIYQQIVHSVKTMVMTSKLHPHEKITSVRGLAKQLNINPNTVQKAYRILEKEGIIYSVAGKGDYVADNAGKIKELRRSEIRDMFERATREAKSSGMWIDEIFTIIDEVYSSES